MADKTDHGTVNFLTPENEKFYAADIYESLDSASREIRVVELFKGQKDDAIRLRFHQHLTLNNVTIPYQALSYVAGEVTETTQVLVDGTQVNVFASIGSSLPKLRRADESVYLWIDQLCIDQSDADERAQQVLMMRDIYAKASQVVVWLDDDDQNGIDVAAFHFVATLKSHNKAYFELHQHTFSTRSKAKLARVERMLSLGVENEGALIRKRRNSYNSSSPHSDGYAASISSKKGSVPKSGEIHLSDSDDENYNENPRSRYRRSRGKAVKRLLSRMTEISTMQDIKVLLHLLSKPWWTRCWTLQEAVLGAQVILRCGRLSTSLWHLDCAFSIVCRAYQTFSLDFPDQVLERLDARQREMLESGPRQAIALRLHRRKQRANYFRGSEILFLARQRGATDKRDLVYSVLGLVDPAYKITVSYANSNTVTDTFIDAAVAVIRYEGNLDFISQAGETNRDQELNLPTWVPDLTAKPAPFNLFSIRASKLDDRSAPNASLLFGRPPDSKYFDQGLENPLFVKDPETGQYRTVQVTVLKLGRLAEDILNLGDVRHQPESRVWERCTEFASDLVGGRYLWTEPRCYQDIASAVDMTLAAGFSSDGMASHWTIHDQDVNEFVAMKRRRAVLLNDTWRLFVTPDRKIGICPSAARKTDVLCIALRSRAPWILRPCPGRVAHFTFVGPCYLHGYMQGQAFIECSRLQRVPALTPVRIV